jgi:hypothetical protein
MMDTDTAATQQMNQEASKASSGTEEKGSSSNEENTKCEDDKIDQTAEEQESPFHRSIMFCGFNMHGGVEDVREAIALVLGDETHERLEL